MGGSRQLVFILACAVSWMLYLQRYAWGVIKPYLAEENPALTSTELGWLDAAFQATYALGQVPGGMLGDLLGPRLVLSCLLLLWSLASAAAAWTLHFWALIGVRAAFGLAQAGAYPTLNRLSRDWFPLATRTSVQGAVTALGRIGAACAPLLLATLLMDQLGFSWQSALVQLSLPALPLAALCWWGLRRPHEPAPLAPAVAGARPLWRGDRAAQRSLAMMLLYAFTSTFQDQLYVYWIPSFLRQGRGLGTFEMGLFTPLPLLGGAVGGVCGGILNDVLLRRLPSRRWVRSGVAFTGKFVAALLIVLSLQVEQGHLAMVVLLVARFFADWSLPTQWGAITDMGGRATGTLFGIVNAVGAAGGALAGPVLGALKAYYGWDGLFYGVAFMCMLSAVSWFGIDCTRRLVAD